MSTRLCILALCVFTMVGCASSPFGSPDRWVIVPGVRVGKITAKSSEADLRSAYGKENVRTGKIDLGEGEFVQGTILFPDDPARRLEIAWKDPETRQFPSRIFLNGRKSLWKTPEGISLGTTLKELEALNGRPFGLAGFGWDYGGTVYSWRGGKVDQLFSKTWKIYLRLGMWKDKAVTREEEASVLGEAEYSSENIIMQKINPRIHQMVIELVSSHLRISTSPERGNKKAGSNSRRIRLFTCI